MVFGLVGGGLIALEGLVDLVRGVVYLAIGYGVRAFGPFDQALLFLVIGVVIAFFAAVGGRRDSDRAVLSGVVLIVIVLAGFLVLGFGSGVLVLLGALLALISGVAFVVVAR